MGDAIEEAFNILALQVANLWVGEEAGRTLAAQNIVRAALKEVGVMNILEDLYGDGKRVGRHGGDTSSDPQLT
jgi:hypothetical protein